MKQNIISTA